WKKGCGPSDWGQQNIWKFPEVHECNSICKLLALHSSECFGTELQVGQNTQLTEAATQTVPAWPGGDKPSTCVLICSGESRLYARGNKDLLWGTTTCSGESRLALGNNLFSVAASHGHHATTTAPSKPSLKRKNNKSNYEPAFPIPKQTHRYVGNEFGYSMPTMEHTDKHNVFVSLSEPTTRYGTEVGPETQPGKIDILGKNTIKKPLIDTNYLKGISPLDTVMYSQSIFEEYFFQGYRCV
ncbi:hypothetical protein DL93DRAFT_2103829, partial [Clavulina sp. PMI_390]